MPEHATETVAVDGPFEPFMRPADHIADHIVVDWQRGIITVDDENLPWDVAGDVRVSREPDEIPAVTMTIVCTSVALGRDYSIKLDDLHLPWTVGATGPRVEGDRRGPTYRVTVELLADRVTEIGEQRAIDAEAVVDAEVVNVDE